MVFWELLWKRAKRFIVRAERDLSEADFDGACFNSGQALQLAAKATLYRLFGERIRLHSSKALLLTLRNLLVESGKSDVAQVIDDAVSRYRRELELLEESYIESRYGEVEYNEVQGRTCVEVAKKFLEVLKNVEELLAKASD